MNSSIPQAEISAIAVPRGGAGLLQAVKARLPALRFRVGAAARADGRRPMLDAVAADMMHNFRVAPEIATGLPCPEADVPSFMPSGFGRR